MPTRQIAEWSISGHWCARIRRLGLKWQKQLNTEILKQARKSRSR
jgi:hypothetical protein